MIRIRIKRGLGRPSAKSRGGETSDGGRDSQLPNSVGELLGSLKPNWNGAPPSCTGHGPKFRVVRGEKQDDS